MRLSSNWDKHLPSIRIYQEAKVLGRVKIRFFRKDLNIMAEKSALKSDPIRQTTEISRFSGGKTSPGPDNVRLVHHESLPSRSYFSALYANDDNFSGRFRSDRLKSNNKKY